MAALDSGQKPLMARGSWRVRLCRAGRRDRRRLPRLFADHLYRRAAEPRPGRRLQAAGRRLEDVQVSNFAKTSAPFCANRAREFVAASGEGRAEDFDAVVRPGGNGRIRGRSLRSGPFCARRRRRRRADPAASEAAFYKAQLEEIRRDVERGLLPQGEAESARAEAARRLIAAACRTPRSPPPPARRNRLAAAALVAVGLPAIAFSLYARLGQPAAARRAVGEP